MERAQEHALGGARASESAAKQQVQKIESRGEVQALLCTLNDQCKVPSSANTAVSLIADAAGGMRRAPQHSVDQVRRDDHPVGKRASPQRRAQQS